MRNRQYLPMNRKVDTGPCKFNLDADSEMEASPLQILEALFANEGTLVTHTGSFHLLYTIYKTLIFQLKYDNTRAIYNS